MVKTLITERRGFIRAKRVLSIEYRTRESHQPIPDKNWKLSVTHDMSASGLSFYSEGEYRVDDLLEIHVVMSGVLDIFTGFARVVRVEKKKNAAFAFIAVKFESASPKPTRKSVKQNLSKTRKRIAC
ncbi:MAG: PilZ domain-containing protein [Candidatus Omnitrophica bacterium]|nr:PilZ domain-containing protein [Candidatus Omnitrophota bacterium]